MFEDREIKMKNVETELLNLKISPLYKYRIQNKYFPVIGEGSLGASVMFIGEAPGKNEALSGKPFCGRSGKILDELLQSVGIKREDVYVTNIVKDRPQDNRDPTEEEINIYAPFLDKQIEIIKPKIIATLGRFSMVYIMNHLGLSNKLGPIGAMHGKTFKTKTTYGEANVVPLYHPAVAVYNSKMKQVLMADFKVLADIS